MIELRYATVLVIFMIGVVVGMAIMYYNNNRNGYGSI